SGTVSDHIAKAASTVHIGWADSTYDGTANAASATVAGVAADGDLLPHATFVYFAGSTATGTPLAGAPVNAGTYTVRASFDGNDNYDSSSDTKTITIGKADQMVDVEGADANYDGTANADSATVTGVAADGELLPHA